MKRLILVLILILTTIIPASAIDETPLILNDLLNVEDEDAYVENKNIPDITIEKGKTFQEKIHEALTAKVEKTDAPYHMLHEVLTKEFENGPFESVRLWGAYQGQIGVHFPQNSHVTTDYTENYINVGIDGKFKGGKEDFRFMANLHNQHKRNFWQNMPADIYIATNRIPHHRIMLGNIRPPVGVDGGKSPFLLEFISRSQIGRNYGSVRKFGARVIGNYDFIDYDIGGYSSDTYFKKFFPGAEFTGLLTLKPLAKTDGKYGKIRIGGGINTGQYESKDFFVANAHIIYEYKKFFADFEYARANGSNGTYGFKKAKSDGFYTTVGYKITPKMQVIARYDQFNPDRNVSNNIRREYTAGINYFIKGQGLKLILNYVFCQNQGKNDSHRIMTGAQILL